MGFSYSPMIWESFNIMKKIIASCEKTEYSIFKGKTQRAAAVYLEKYSGFERKEV